MENYAGNVSVGVFWHVSSYPFPPLLLLLFLSCSVHPPLPPLNPYVTMCLLSLCRFFAFVDFVIFVVAGGAGAGKVLLLLWLLFSGSFIQIYRRQRRVVLL